jgi:hypothetical protein
MKSIAKIDEGDLTKELRNSITLNEHSARNENKRSPRRTAFSNLSKTREIEITQEDTFKQFKHKEAPEAVVST